MTDYIATLALTNTGGIGIVYIDHTEDTVTFDVITDKVIDSCTAGILYRNKQYGFYWGKMFLPLGDFTYTDI